MVLNIKILISQNISANINCTMDDVQVDLGQNKNKSATRGAQSMPIGIPTICQFNSVSNLMYIIKEVKTPSYHYKQDKAYIPFQRSAQ